MRTIHLPKGTTMFTRKDLFVIFFPVILKISAIVGIQYYIRKELSKPQYDKYRKMYNL